MSDFSIIDLLYNSIIQPMKNNKVCVFAGSNNGAGSEYADAASALGRELAKRGLGLVFGGGGTGLMGATADAVLHQGGEVIGVIPTFLINKEGRIVHDQVTELHVVGSMHERKALMFELSDCFIALPGGLGTFEEILEVLTWRQLGLHDKPCAVLNVDGYFDRLLDFLDHAVAERFIQPEERNRLIAETTPESVLNSIEKQNIINNIL